MQKRLVDGWGPFDAATMCGAARYTFITRMFFNQAEAGMSLARRKTIGRRKKRVFRVDFFYHGDREFHAYFDGKNQIRVWCF